MRVTKRSAILLGILLLSIVAALAVSQEEGATVVEAASRKPAVFRTSGDRAGGRDQQAGPILSDEHLGRLAMRKIDGDFYPLFPAVPKIVLATTAPGASPSAEPSAPPLPFKYLGQMTEDGLVTIFLAVNERYIVARAGDTIDDVYRVEAIQGGVVEFTYLPLKQKQVLPVGERS